MATLEKLSINGIRSFGEDEAGRQMIRFQKPVTLIQGANGCGKSTIIECLRFVTTNKEPSGKGVFVRDPDLTSHATVKAVVKLKLKTSGGDTVELSRGIQGTRARKTISQKSLDSTLSVRSVGQAEPVQLSSKCGDITQEVIRRLGISKAILDNVIFCTQEDSFWPLETDKALKEKFDQIFDSEKYNKCLLRVKEVQKKLKNSKGQLEQDLAHQREKKTAAHKKLCEIANMDREINHMQKEIEDREAALVPVLARLGEIRNQEHEVSKVMMKHTEKKTELAGLEREENSLRGRIQDEFAGTNEELDIELAVCHSQNMNSNELKTQHQILKKQAEDIDAEIGKNRGRVGQLTKMVEINKCKIAEKENKLALMGSECGIATASEEDIRRYIKDKENEVVATQKEHEKQEEICQSKVDKARDEIVNKRGDLKRLEDALKENRAEEAEIRRDIASVGESQLRRERVADQLRVAERELSNHEVSIDVAALTAELQKLQSELKVKDNELSTADAEVKRLQTFSETGREVESTRIEINKKEAQNRLLLNSQKGNLMEVLGVVPEKNFKPVVQKRADELAASANELRNRKAQKEGEKLALKSSVATIGSQLQRMNNELREFQTKLEDTCDGLELDEAVKKCAGELDALQKQKGDLDVSRGVFKTYIKSLKDPKPCCPLCSRDFATEQEAKALADKLSNKIQVVPSQLIKVEASLKEKQDFQRKLFDIQSCQPKLNTLQNNEVPTLEKELSEKKAAITRATKEIEEMEQKLKAVDKDRETCTSLLGDMALLDQNMKGLDGLKVELRRLEPGLPAGWHRDLLKKAEKVQEEISTERKQLKQQRDHLQQKITGYNEKLTSLQNRKHKLAEEELSLRSKDGQQKVQEERLASLKNTEQNLRDGIEAARALIHPLQESHEQRALESKNLKESNKNLLKQINDKLDGLRIQFRDILRLQEEITESSRRGDDQKLEALNADIAESEQRLKSTTIKMESVASQLQTFSAIEVRRLNLVENKHLREKVRERQALKKVVDEIKKQLDDMQTRSLAAEKKRLDEQEAKILGVKANLSGQINTMMGQKTRVKEELDSPMYKDIDQKFTASLITLKTSEVQALDLHRYCVAMDYAMGVYHKKAMEKVNGFIREYWQKIYRGNDIDFIEIQTEQAEATEQRRSFNYKLVQVKEYARLDMRNRCSAGQKMLACLIVRMALAEVFSSNCGILTLDEPTTNLDKKNIQMLAETLNDLISAKSSLNNTNFQLVVITHDKEFLKMITSANEVENYIEVSRSPNGTSQITIRPVTD